jgi:ribokinase
VRHAIRLCRGLGVFTILDLAPVPPRGLPRDILSVDLLTPNETEAGALIGNATTRASDPTDALLKRGAQAVALKRGSRGSIFASADGTRHIGKPFKVTVVDTTAAGDAFTAALAVAHAQALSPPEMLRFANAAGALCCERLGAQPALPTRRAVDQLLRTGKGRRARA